MVAACARRKMPSLRERGKGLAQFCESACAKYHQGHARRGRATVLPSPSLATTASEDLARRIHCLPTLDCCAWRNNCLGGAPTWEPFFATTAMTITTAFWLGAGYGPQNFSQSVRLAATRAQAHKKEYAAARPKKSIQSGRGFIGELSHRVTNPSRNLPRMKTRFPRATSSEAVSADMGIEAGTPFPPPTMVATKLGTSAPTKLSTKSVPRSRSDGTFRRAHAATKGSPARRLSHLIGVEPQRGTRRGKTRIRPREPTRATLLPRRKRPTKRRTKRPPFPKLAWGWIWAPELFPIGATSHHARTAH